METKTKQYAYGGINAFQAGIMTGPFPTWEKAEISLKEETGGIIDKSWSSWEVFAKFMIKEV